MTPKPRKPRKPKPISLDSNWFIEIVKIEDHDLKDWKRLHKWLGRAIAYLESKND